MRYRLTAEVEGRVYLEAATFEGSDGIRYELLTDASGRLAQVAVSMQVDPASFATTMTDGGSGGAALTIALESDPEVCERLVQALRRLEALLAFPTAGGLRRILWDRPSEERVPESEEDRAYLAVTAHLGHPEYDVHPVYVEAGAVCDLIERAGSYEALLMPKAFLHEGLREFESFRYIQAFYGFFFVLEDMFARGKSGLTDVLKEFSRSPEMERVSRQALAIVCKDERHDGNINRFFAEEHCDRTVAGTQRLLLKVRGNLHHYYGQSSKRQGTPFSQKDFESMALLAMTMASLAIGYREATISRELASRQAEAVRETKQ